MIEAFENNLRITGSMLIGNANALLEAGQKLLEQKKDSKEIVFDLSNVKETDSSAISILLSFMRKAEKNGVRIQIANPPAGMLSLAQMYGVIQILPFV